MQCLARDPRQAPERFLAPISSICTTAIIVTRIRRIAAQHELGLGSFRDIHQFVEVDCAPLLRRGLVAHEVEDLANVGNRRSMRQVTAVRKIHRQHRVAGIEEGE